MAEIQSVEKKYSTSMLPANKETLASAVEHVISGAVIAVPTDTVYGVVCRFDSEEAIDQLYWVKERPPQKALPVLLGDEGQLDRVIQAGLSPLAGQLIRQFWPGPLTIVLPALSHLPSILNSGGDTIAVRIPDHPFLRDLARQAGPLASSSANRSGQPDCRTAQAVLDQLTGRVPLIVDGGETVHLLASTVLDLTGEEPLILREGPLGQTIRAWLEQQG
jgi:L-threonylcarbamoyladenylate synthase